MCPQRSPVGRSVSFVPLESAARTAEERRGGAYMRAEASMTFAAAAEFFHFGSRATDESSHGKFPIFFANSILSNS